MHMMNTAARKTKKSEKEHADRHIGFAVHLHDIVRTVFPCFDECNRLRHFSGIRFYNKVVEKTLHLKKIR
jgi:hypothetical protein